MLVLTFFIQATVSVKSGKWERSKMVGVEVKGEQGRALRMEDFLMFNQAAHLLLSDLVKVSCRPPPKSRAIC